MNQVDIPQASNASLGARVRILFVGLAMLIGGCAEPGVNAQLPPLVEDKKPVSQDYVGLSESQARDLARDRETPFRVVTRDGVSLMVTFDFVRGRINADIVDGVVVAYAIEGAERRTKQGPGAAKTPK